MWYWRRKEISWTDREEGRSILVHNQEEKGNPTYYKIKEG
jgi:hypothetical protein